VYLEVRCLGYDTHQTVSLNIVRRPNTTPIHELERYMCFKDCSQLRGYPYKRSHFGGAAAQQDFCRRPAVQLVAGRAVKNVAAPTDGEEIMRLILAVGFVCLLTVPSDAACVCRCVNGEMQPLCDSSIDLPPMCPPTLCSIAPPSIAPIQPLGLPPLGTSGCTQQQVLNPSTQQYERRRVCD
jgi:hypothetical protein